MPVKVPGQAGRTRSHQYCCGHAPGGPQSEQEAGLSQSLTTSDLEEGAFSPVCGSHAHLSQDSPPGPALG